MRTIGDMWDQLAAYGVPNTLVHGDLHLGNVASDDGHFLFFDWGQGCVSHPFFDMVVFSTEEELDPQFLERYLTFWTRYNSMDRLREAWALAKPLSGLNNAIVYYHAIRQYGPVPEEMMGALSFELRKFLEFAD